MSQLRFNHFAVALMVLSFISAFLAPPRFANPARGELAGLFAPISRPVRSIASLVYGRFHHETIVDDASPATPRSEQTILEENRQLHLELAALQLKFDNLSKLNADRHLVGDILPLCQPATVTGSDPSVERESLFLSTSSGVTLAAGRPVLCAPHSLVGRIVGAGLGAAHVRLITDPGVSTMCRIAQYKTAADGTLSLEPIPDLPVLVQGIGKEAMAVRSNLSLQKVKDLAIAPGDTVILDDPEWPANLQGWCVGKITRITPQPRAAMVSDIRVEPLEPLARQTEVMVMVKD